MSAEKSRDAASLLAKTPTATIYEAAGKRGDMAPAVRQMVPGLGLAGPAYTVRCWPGDLLGLARAIEDAAPGDVLVVDAGATDRSTIAGGTTLRAAHYRGIAGLVTNGAIRDLDELIEIGFPVYAVGVSVRGAAKCHPGWLREPVAVGDCVVASGDYVVADRDGVVVVAAAQMEEVAREAARRREQEAERDRLAQAGHSLLDLLGVKPGG